MAGGFRDVSLLDSVEILDTVSGSWKTGPKLPEIIICGVMVEDPEGGLVYIGGRYSIQLYRLSDVQSQWVVMEQSLNAFRPYPVAFLIPDEITNCTLV